MNRDELLTRAPSEAPRCRDVGSLRAVAPRDPEGNGTWVGVNTAGLAVALANVYPTPPPPPPSRPISRGRLVMDALGRESIHEIGAFLEEVDLPRYKPFLLFAFAPGDDPRGARWDGNRLEAGLHTDPGLVATSSSRDQGGAERIRRALFDAAAAAEGGLTSSLLEDLHRSREPEPGPYAVSMERSDAATVSMSTIVVSPTEVSFQYVPGPPHATPADPPIVLPRLAPSTEAPPLPPRG